MTPRGPNVDEVSPCPDCGTETTENYLGLALCWGCAQNRLLTNANGLRVRSADLTRARPPRWAWKDRLVIGYLNLLLGNEGIGKSVMMAWLIAQLTRGKLEGDLYGTPVTVGVLGDEDSFDDVWAPRLHAAGADLDRVVQVDRPDGGFVNLREDHDKLTAVVIEHALQVLFFDQLLDNLGVGTDDWRQKAVREALQPLRALARELDIAATGCLHPNKRADNFRSLVAGAPAFNAVSRSSLLLAQHPDDERKRVLVRGKGNLSQAPPAVEFEVVEYQFQANGMDFKVPRVANVTSGDMTVDDLLAANGGPYVGHTQVRDASEIIESLLPQDGAWHPAKPIIDACAEHDLDVRTAQRARGRLGVEHRRTRTFPAAVEWRWPPTEDTHTSSDSAVASVASVASGEARKASLDSSDDTHDSDDSAGTRDDCGASALGIDPDAELERIRVKFGSEANA